MNAQAVSFTASHPYYSVEEKFENVSTESEAFTYNIPPFALLICHSRFFAFLSVYEIVMHFYCHAYFFLVPTGKIMYIFYKFSFILFYMQELMLCLPTPQ